ncbi:MAG: hypothetical protein HY319_05535 [Armatimonadetes bacterium]|nr:hypothetical protein [Armatimonadota bacterium]
MTLSGVPVFGRQFFASGEPFARIGSGSLGGKAKGLVGIHEALRARFGSDPCAPIEVTIPASVVITTEVFDAFMGRNRIKPAELTRLSDERISHLFLQADFPVEFLGDLRALAEEVRVPLALRSSSLLEDALYRPFAGVYGTKMIPNDQPDQDARFRKLIEVIKYVYSTTYFGAARAYRETAADDPHGEKMAVLIQEIVGERHGDRFYPTVSGVARSFNYYPFPPARREEGVVNLALGLGKTIVDGGVSWIYSPAHPAAPPPYGSLRDLLTGTQLHFWAVGMGRPREHNPIAETEHLVRAHLQDADYDGTLKWVASTYQAGVDRIVLGTATPGPRVLNFGPLLILDDIPFNSTVREMLTVCEQAMESPVEIELALNLPRRGSAGARLGFLQVRPMVVSNEEIEVQAGEMAAPETVIASSKVLGNGRRAPIRDIVYVRPEAFDARLTSTLVGQIAARNTELVQQGRRYLLIGFGRWGSADPWLGIPAQWGHISGACVIVEAMLSSMNIEFSQGSHFFHNLSSFGVSYFSVPHTGGARIDWDWLNSQEACWESELVRHVRLDEPLEARVDGRTGRGVISRTGAA